MKYIFYIFAAATILATILSIIRLQYWWIRIFDFPRLQVMFLGIVACFAFALMRHYSPYAVTILILLLLSIAWQVYMILPFFPVAPKQVESSPPREEGHTLRLMIVNVQMDNRNSSKCITVIKKAAPDILLAVETDAWWQEQLDGLNDVLPHKIGLPLDNTYGMLLYSRLQLIDPLIRFLVKDDVPMIHTGIELEPGAAISFYGVHPEPPIITENDSSEDRDLELILVAKEIKNDPVPVLVAGDLNDVAWSRTTTLFQKISGLLDPRRGRGFYNTFHARHWYMRWALDHIFLSRHFKLVSMQRLEKIGSDHFPILVILKFHPLFTREQENPQPDKEDINEMKEKTGDSAKSRGQETHRIDHPGPISSCPAHDPITAFGKATAKMLNSLSENKCAG
ncbi:MAG: endonuclease/exonuclease/phosphatase family protein [Desulfobulbaceae bacterium]|nr:endonuclease/exonuclease/phosphatase family protein [Desulfobulbaceae bacterium]